MPITATQSFVKTAILLHEKEAATRRSESEKREQDLRH
jgi:hypothetical protein